MLLLDMIDDDYLKLCSVSVVLVFRFVASLHRMIFKVLVEGPARFTIVKIERSEVFGSGITFVYWLTWFDTIEKCARGGRFSNIYHHS